MAKKINIAAELNAATVDGKLADASQIYDSKKGKFQEKFNEEIEAKVESYKQELEQDVTDAVANLVGGASETFDTLKEFEDWVNNDESGAAAIAKQTNENKNAVADLNANTGISEYPSFDPAVDYAVGDVVNYEGRLRRFVAEHEAGEWNGTDAEEWSERKEVKKKALDIIGAEDNNIIDIVWNEGYYRNEYGSIVPLTEYSYSEPIHFMRKANIRALLVSGPAVAAIAKVNQDGEFIKVVAKSQSNDETKYDLIIEEDCFISFSCVNKYRDNIKIFRFELLNVIPQTDKSPTEGSLNPVSSASVYSLLKRVEKNEDVLGIKSYVTINKDNEGFYRTVAGAIAPNSGYFYTNPISVKEGDVIRFIDIASTSAVALVSQVDEDGNFVKLLLAGNNQDRDYAHIVAEDCFISISVPSHNIDKKVLIYSSDLLKAYTIIYSKEYKGLIEELSEEVSYEANRAIQAETLLQQNISTEVARAKQAESTLQENIDAFKTTKDAFGVYKEENVSEDIIISGAYRNVNSALSAHESYGYTMPIQVTKGTCIYAEEVLATTGVSVISEVDESNKFIKVLLGGGTGKIPYYYIVEKNCYISISCVTEYLTRFKIVNIKSVEALSNMNKEINFNDFLAEKGSNLGIIDNENPLAYIIRDAGYGSIIHKWGIIGDSLSSGEMDVYIDDVHDRYIDMYEYSWGKRFAKMIGAECYNFSNGGQTTKGWITGGSSLVRDETYEGGIGGGGWDLAQRPENLKQGYIIALGVNDKRMTYGVGTVEDIDTTDYNNNGETFIGYYAGIIQRVKSVQPMAKIFCITPLGSTYAEYAQAIRDVVSSMETIYEGDIYTIDLDRYYPISWSGQYLLNSHGSAMGYQYCAYAVNTYIDWIIRKNGLAFRKAALIGLDNVE